MTLFLFTWKSALCQEPESQDTPKVYQLSGLVLNKATREPVPFAKVHVRHTRRTVICSQEGFYSIPVTKEDTVLYLCLGYKPNGVAIGDYLKNYMGDPGSGYIYIINYLVEDSITLPTVMIYPYDTPTELRTAILETKIPTEGLEVNAKNNLDPKVMDNLMKNMPVDNGERMLAARQLYSTQYTQAHVMPTFPLLNPMAILQLLNYIKERSKKERDDHLNDWEE